MFAFIVYWSTQKINILLNTTECDSFKSKVLHLMYLNINSLLPKIDKLRYIARFNNAAVTGISESKLEKSITHSDILRDNYDLQRCDRNKNRGGVSCCISNYLSYTEMNHFLMTLKMFSLKSICQKSNR